MADQIPPRTGTAGAYFRVDPAGARAADERFQRGVAALTEYARAHGSAEVPAGYTDADGFPLGAWVAEQRLRRLEDRLELVHCSALEQVPGWCWDPPH